MLRLNGRDTSPTVTQTLQLPNALAVLFNGQLLDCPSSPGTGDIWGPTIHLNGLSELLHQLTQKFSFRASTPSGSSSSKIIVVVSSRQ